jgi:flagellar biosynthesis/type III secretory pathway protein FliH
MRTRLANLEDFSAPQPGGGGAEEGPGPEWHAGYAAGRADAATAAATAAAQSGAQLAQAMADIGFTFAEARALCLQSLQPLFETLIAQVLPGLAPTANVAGLARLILHAAATDLSGPVILQVPPSEVIAVRQALQGLGPAQLTVRADADLQPGQARLSCSTQETALDVPRLLAAAADILRAALNGRTMESRHG